MQKKEDREDVGEKWVGFAETIGIRVAVVRAKLPRQEREKTG